MTEKTDSTHVPADGRMPACSASYWMPDVRTNFSNQSFRVFDDRVYSKTLQINRLFDYLFNKHAFLCRQIVAWPASIYLKELMLF